ncbi:hypothetical protein A6V39_03610 [Candidatus Mycoplasma haematobovis]|uniref:Uncharacterized protein n=1 Tax=Candidatus Mycoplasma haematobovis TaxID=432608 RepID=A0A1A9QBY5_9MOLU|nr:hypothetical protein [Candidatus Mycoplasma haematobovis]OAL09973.1 hypothetical protein A6V39_03610 [Candidatus Mycoplasma haematobovis]
MNLTIIKGVAGLVGASGLGVGSYYTCQALKTKETNPKTVTVDNIRSALQKARYTPFQLDSEGWTNKFKEFRDHQTHGTKFAAVFKDKYPNLTITKGQDLTDGGNKFQALCEGLFNKEENTTHEHQNLANAKLFCATAPAS